jgi:uncharacterized protein (UPF0147 family)
MESKEIGDVITILDEVKEDATVPKNVRAKIENATNLLNADSETHIKVNKVLSVLEDIAEDVNLQPYTRTQIWDAISGLEKAKQ